MRFNEIVNKPKGINFIKEAYSGQFTIGFELEGICTWKQHTDELFHLPSYGSYSEENQPRGGAKLLKDYLDKLFIIDGSSGSSKIEKDSSLDTKGFDEESGFAHSWNFEYATNRIPFNAKNVEKIYNGLTELGENGVYTNNSCGFHIHMSFPDIDKKEVAWIICCLSIDEELLQDMLKLDTEYGTIHLFNSKKNSEGDEIGGYAKYHYLLDIGTALKEERYDEVDEKLNNEKYNVLHIHSENGTIEWRGPRGFLDNNDTKVVKQFILKWFKLVSKIAKITQSTSYTVDGTTINKKELLSHLSLNYFNLNSPVEKSKEEKRKNLFDLIDDAPVKLFSLNPNAIKKLYGYNYFKTIRIFYELASNDMFGEDWAMMKNESFNTIFDLYSTYYESRPEEIITFIESLWYPLIDNNSSILQKLNNKNKNKLLKLCSKIILDNDSKNLTDEVYEIAEDLNIFNSIEFKNELEKRIKNNEVFDFNNILDISTLLPAYIWNILMNNRYVHYISRIPNVPEKYQIRMIKKDPYNIQYITNPTEKVIKMLEEKISNVKDFIRGE